MLFSLWNEFIEAGMIHPRIRRKNELIYQEKNKNEKNCKNPLTRKNNHDIMYELSRKTTAHDLDN